MVRSAARLDAAGLIEHRLKRAPLWPAPANPNAIGYGGLASYAASFAKLGWHAGASTAKILKAQHPPTCRSSNPMNSNHDQPAYRQCARDHHSSIVLVRATRLIE
jgi:hypothetical protein